MSNTLYIQCLDDLAVSVVPGGITLLQSFSLLTISPENGDHLLILIPPAVFSPASRPSIIQGFQCGMCKAGLPDTIYSLRNDSHTTAVSMAQRLFAVWTDP